MKAIEEITKEEVREILNANWMTHDAAWFGLSVEQFGIEQTNIVNRKAVRLMAKTEAKRLRKMMGVKTITGFSDLKTFMANAFTLIKGAFMKFELDFPAENTMVWNIPRCFAHDGVKRLGLIDTYQCGIVERLFGWLEELEIQYTVENAPTGCNLHMHGKCQMVFHFFFAERA